MNKSNLQEQFDSNIELKLIENAKQGNQNAFRMLVEQYEGVVAATVMGMLGDTVEAKDVGQETFIRLFKSLDKFRNESSLKTYIVRIAINLSLNELKSRKRKRQHFVEDENDFLKNNKYSSSENDTDNKEIIEKALKQLKPRDRSMIVLRLIQGYSTKETAEMLELPIGTVLSGLSRAQKKLKKIITELE